MPQLSAEDFVRIVMRLNGVDTLDQLAPEGRTRRTLQRWQKDGFPESVIFVLDALEEAGMLRSEVAETIDAARARRLAVQIADSAGVLADLL